LKRAVNLAASSFALMRFFVVSVTFGKYPIYIIVFSLREVANKVAHYAQNPQKSFLRQKNLIVY
jgi:hypothetical protein